MLGSVDCNTGDTLVGWDTDQFAMNIRDTTKAMQIVVEQGGLAPGGLNFDCKVRRESTDLEDFFIAHIGGMDAFARTYSTQNSSLGLIRFALGFCTLFFGRRSVILLVTTILYRNLVLL
jgi:xylose isomerase